MGLKSGTIRKRLIMMIVWILTWSFVCTIVTWLIYIVIIANEKVNPANYYERMVPAIEKKVGERKGLLAVKSGQEKLEQIVPAKGFRYKVVDKKGVFLYGRLTDQEDVPPKELSKNLNLVEGDYENVFVKYIPITDGEGNVQGVLILYYELKMTSVDEADSYLLPLGTLVFLITPFVYFILFTFIFVRRLSKEINAPLKQLMNATAYIRNRDLDFTIAPFEKIVEIQYLTESFEDMRNALQQSLEREWKLEKARKDMVAALAHDIRTPLTIIHGHIEGLEEAKKKDIDRFDRYLHVIKMNVQRAVKLVHDLNQTAVLEHDQFRLSKSAFDLVAFLDEKAREYTLMCKSRNVDFKSGIQDNRKRKDHMIADADRLSQVLDNVIANSIRFAEEGSIRFEVAITDTMLSLKITDDGPGFKNGEDAIVFTSFYQGNSGNRGNGHAGLGLYIAKSIIEKHGGSIQAGNNGEKGAVIAIRIPFISAA